jgi:hemolysin III
MFPDYSRAERQADDVIHLAGICLSITAVVLLLAVAVPPGAALRDTAAIVYCIDLVAMVGASAAYHLVAGARWKESIRRCDRAAIYLMIARSYTPFALVAIGGTVGAALLVVVWPVAFAGAALALLRPRRFERAVTVVYLALGWVGLPLLGRFVDALAGPTLALLGAGRFLYSAGVGFHLRRRLPFQNAVWHGCVLAAAACHFVAVAQVLSGKGVRG